MQLPTLWFSIIMVGLMLDHFFFKSRRLTPRAKRVVFALVVGAVVGTFWLFRACAWGIEGASRRLISSRCSELTCSLLVADRCRTGEQADLAQVAQGAHPPRCRYLAPC